MKTKLLAAAAVMMIPLAGLAAEPETMPPSETTGPGATFDVVSVNDLGEACYASPAASHGHIYQRGERHLFAIGGSQRAAR